MRRLLRAWDRAFHPLRRRWATLALKTRCTLYPPRQILVVCYGNLCRSPFAARLLARALEAHGVVVRSAGLGAIRVTPPAMAITAAGRRGTPIDGHVSTPVTHAMVAEADLMIAMDARQRRTLSDVFGVSPRRILVLGDCDPEPIDRRGIPDPITGTSLDFDACYARIERCVTALVAILEAARSARSESTTPSTGRGEGGGADGAGRSIRPIAEATERSAATPSSQPSTIAGIQSSIANSS